MDSKNNQNIIKKLIRDELNADEQVRLLQSRGVEEEMKSQWENLPDMAGREKIDGNFIWKQIKGETWERLPAKRSRFYKIYSLVASVILLVGFVGTFLYIANNEKDISMYIVTSGVRSIETITLPDGSSVQLGPGSVLTYPSAFTGKIREVKLDGQAFFDVQTNASFPFIVRTSNMDVEALGTAFELFCHSANNSSEAILLNGKIKVNFNTPEPGRSQALILEPNEKVEYIGNEKKIVRSTVNADSYTSWRKRGILSFEHEKLSVIIPRLEQWYGRKIDYPKEIAESHKFTFKVRDETLELILYIMCESSPIQYTKTEEGDYSLYLIK